MWKIGKFKRKRLIFGLYDIWTTLEIFGLIGLLEKKLGNKGKWWYLVLLTDLNFCFNYRK